MAADSTNQQMNPREFTEKMAAFPCMFNLPYLDHPPMNRLRNRKDELERALGEKIESPEVLRKMRNTLTWIYVQLDLRERARKINEQSMETGNTKLVTLANCVCMKWNSSGKVSGDFLNDLIEMSSTNNNLAEAIAEQAYFLGQLGGIYNLMNAVDKYKEALDSLASKNNDEWRYGLGLAYRRLAVMPGLEKYSDNKLTESNCHEEAKNCFEKVAESSDQRLKAMSLANLAATYTDPLQISKIYQVTEAYPDNPEVLYICGRALVSKEDSTRADQLLESTRAIQLLEQALEMDSERSVIHHYLGKAYKFQLSFMDANETREERTQIQEKIIKHLSIAYKTSNKMNLSPLLDLVKLYQSMNKIDDAKNVASTLLKSCTSNFKLMMIGHKIMFYIDESKMKNRHKYLYLLASIAHMKMRSTTEERQAVWSGLFENTSHPDLLIGRGVKLTYEALQKHREDIIDVFKTISGREASILDTKVREMLTSGKCEEALLFLELVFLSPRMDLQGLRKLHLEALTNQARRCLKNRLGMSGLFFRQAFDLSFSHDGGIPVDSLEDVPWKIDVLMLFNSLKGDERSLCSRTADGLEDAISTLFYLKVYFCPFYDTRDEGEQGQDGHLADFVRNHQTDVILIVFEGDGSDRDTSYLRDKIRPFLRQHQESGEERKPLVTLVQCNDQPDRPCLNLPQELAEIPCLTLGQSDADFPNLFVGKEIEEDPERSFNIDDILKAYFGGNLDNVMTLFKHLLRH